MLLLVPLAAVVTAQPAQAGTQCVNLGSQPWTLCVDVAWYGEGWAHMFFPFFPEPTAPYILVQQCDSAGQFCNTILASVTAGRSTPKVATSAGYTYKGCVDFYDGWNYVAGCTPAEPG
jgi:hypothetical protein